MEKRLVLALVLCVLVLMASQYIWPTKPPSRPPEGQPAAGTTVEPAAGTTREPARGTTGEAGTAPGGPGAEAPLPPAVALPEHELRDRIEVETDDLLLVFTSRGGALREAFLRKYERKPGEVPDSREHWYRILREEMVQRLRGKEERRSSVLTGAVRVLPAEDGPEAREPPPIDTVSWRVVEAGPERAVFDLTLPGGLLLTKTWTVSRDGDRYDVELAVDVRNTGAVAGLAGRALRLSVNGPVGLVPDRGDGARTVQVPIEGIFGAGEKAKIFSATTPARNQEAEGDGRLSRPWVGLANQFFTSALVPDKDVGVSGISLWPVRILERVERLEAELGRKLTSAELALLGVSHPSSCLSCGGPPPKSDAQRALEAELRRPLAEEEYGRLGEASLASCVRVPFEAPAAGESATVFTGMLYLGPKSKEILQRERYAILEGVRDLGFFGIIAEALLWILHLLYAVVGNYGVAIILLTLIVRGSLFPLSRHQQVSMQKYSRQMQRIKPKMDEVRKKHKDNPRKMNEELMKLYKKEGVSMVPKGCLVAFLQIPIFIGLFTGLRTAIELRHASFLWVRDLTGPDHLAHVPFLKNVPLLGGFLPEWLNLLPLLMTVTWYLSARLAPQPVGPQQQQMAKTMRWMPIIFGVMLYNYTAGLALYMTISSLWSIVESKVVRRMIAQSAEQEFRPVIQKP